MSKKKMMIYLPVEQYRWLKLCACVFGESQSATISMLIADMMEREQDLVKKHENILLNLENHDE